MARNLGAERDDLDEGQPISGAYVGWFCGHHAHSRCKGSTGKGYQRRPCECLCHLQPKVEQALSPECSLGGHEVCNGNRRARRDDDDGSTIRRLQCLCKCHNLAGTDRKDRAYPPNPHLIDPSDLEAEFHRFEIAKLYLQGKHPVEIARLHHMKFDDVLSHLEIVKQRWAQLTIIDIDAAIREEIAKLGVLEAEYWEAWKESKVTVLDADMRTGRRGISAAGDSSLLSGVLACIDRRIKLLGLDAPIKVDVSDIIRQQAKAAGFDPDIAVQEGERLMGELRLGGTR